MTDTGLLDRSMRALTIGNVRGANERRTQRELEGLAERQDQFIVPIVGKGEEFPVWSEVHINFNVTFVDATGQRDVPFDRPLMTYGSVVLEGGPVGLLACVTRWDVNKRNEVTGCMLAVGAVATDYARSFTGQVHVSFEGYGAPTEAYGDESQYDDN